MAADVAARRTLVTGEEFDALFTSVRTWGRWGERDERGALNLITRPAVHRMNLRPDTEIDLGPMRFVTDSLEIDYHNDGHSHIDALCHVVFRGQLYNGRGAEEVDSAAAAADSINAAPSGVVGRGVLLDIPAARGEPWIEPGDFVFREDLEAAERAQGVEARDGDILLVRTGHVRRLAELGSWDTTKAKAGLHPTAVTFLAEREIAALGSDGNNDTAPSSTEGVAFPVHVLGVNAMGLYLLDYLDPEALRDACAAQRRWEFLFVAAPLVIPGGTGSPANPVAIL